jgi:hypothetical protein
MQKGEVIDSSVRGMPVPDELLEQLDKQEFYREDQARDDHGRFADEGKGSQEPGYEHPEDDTSVGHDTSWIDKDAEVHTMNFGETHGAAAARLLGLDEGKPFDARKAAFKQGWVRIQSVGDGSTLWMNTEGGEPTPKQVRAAIDIAIETGKQEVLLDSPSKHEMVWSSTMPEGVSEEAKQIRKEAFESVSKRVVDMASKAGFGGEVHVIDEAPKAFTVGGKEFNEAGHYTPSDGSITINLRNAYDDFLPHLIQHEVMHDKFAAAEAMRTREHKEMQDLMIGKGEYDKWLRPSGEPRDEMRAEIEKRWPMSALFAKTIGDSYLEMGADPAGMKIDDGVTEYSKAYWSPEEQGKSGAYWNAVNETLAEMAYLKSKKMLIESPRSGDVARKQLEGMGYQIKRQPDGEPYAVYKWTNNPAVFKSRSRESKLIQSVKKSWKEGSKPIGGGMHPSAEWNQLFAGINRLYDPKWRVMR